MNLGWISLNRKIQSHWLWEEKREFSRLEAWLDILLTVNHSEQKVMIKNALYIVKRGESIKSLDTWANRWNWNKSKVRRFLKLLESDNMIVTKNETQTTRITVRKYDDYQDSRNADETEMKRKRNADETQMTPNNNANNINNDNNVYLEASFLSDWNQAREYYQDTKSNLNKLNKEESEVFNDIIKNFKKKEIQTGIRGIFMQEYVPQDVMQFRPKHFLRNIEQYIDAGLNKKTNLYKK